MMPTATKSLVPSANTFSLERRLMLRLGTLYIIVLIIVSAIYVVLAWSYRHTELADDVDSIATEVANAIHVAADGRAVLNISPTLQHKIDRIGDKKFMVVDSHTGTEITQARTNNFSPEFSKVTPPGYDGDYLLSTHNGEPLHIAIRAIDTAAGHFQIEFQHRGNVSREARDWIWEELGTELMPVILPLLTGTLLITWLTLRASLRPLRRVADEARRITSDAPSVRLDRHEVPREILPVVVAANGALDRLETALHEQQRLMANIAHELRTPLAILRARIESLKDPSVAREVLPDFERVSNLVGRLLTVARLRSEHVSFNMRYELGRVIRECLAQMAPLALAQKKELVLTAPSEPIFVRGNAVALEDAVRNLVDNALRFTVPGQAVNVAISPGCVIEVRDRGPGVAAAIAKHVFEPFWRGNASGNGAGLGLAIAAETVRRHAGQLSVTNAHDGGAVFRMEIPQTA